MMKKLAMLSAAALIAAGTLTATPSEARGRGGAIAAGVIGGLAAGALIGASTSAYAAPAYGYSGYEPVHGYGYRRAYDDDGYDARPRYRSVVRRRVVDYDDDVECRVIVKRRYDAFGDLTVVRKRICD